MPFPLAHPAAALPLRRWCPRYFSFPALIVGNLIPDLGYFFGQPGIGGFSHRFLAGTFGFSLPVGWLMIGLLFLLRPAIGGLSPIRSREALRSLCQRRLGSHWIVSGSLVLGIWTHLLLDSATHQDGWLVEQLPGLRRSSFSVGETTFYNYEALYVGCTFAGVVWLAVSYLSWLERALVPSVTLKRGIKWACGTILASAIVFIVLAGRGEHQRMGLFSSGVATLVAILGFLIASEGLTRSPRG